MAHNILVGANDTANLVNEIYIGVNDVARRVLQVYAGDENGVAQLVYTGSMLPPEYRQVEYIEGTGTQYINTGVHQDANSYALECTFSLATNVYSGNTYLMGVASTRLFVMIYGQDQSQKTQLSLGIGNGWHRESTANVYADKRTYKVDMKNLKAYVDGVSKSATNNSYSRGNTAKAIFAIFTDGVSDGSFGSGRTKGKCYGAKIWKNDVLIHNYYPCYEVSTSTVGMYDIIDKAFLTNAGTGDFTAGPEHKEIL